MTGAALAALVSFFVVCGIRYYVGQKLYPQYYEWRRIATVFGIALAMYLGLSQLSIENVFVSIAVKGLLCLTYQIVLLLVGFYDKKEKAKINQYIRDLRRRLVN